MKSAKRKPVRIGGPRVPAVGDRWIDKGCSRVAIVTGTSEVELNGRTSKHVTYRYQQGVNGSNLWKRGIAPPQTISLEDWTRRFKPEKTV